MVVPIPVCPHGAFLGHGYGIGHSQRQRIPLGHGCGEQDLNGVHGFAQIAAAGPCNIVKNPILRHGFQTGALFHKGDRPLHRFQRRLLGDLLELEHRRPAQNGVEHIKIGIFRGGSNEGNLSVFDVFQKGLLLLFIKGLNLIQIQQHTVGSHEGIQLGGDLPDVCRRSSGGVELEERPVGLLGNDIGNGGLSHTRWPIEDHIGNGAAFNDAAQHLSLGQQMGLSHHIFQRPGTQFIGKR